ncbi:acyl-CoA thioesterase [Hazenella sp. IB182357]|uniref:Acyl-CoA thioesterase n=1 Tax=Polycladospora coralii TaxID=2771432 RepID=A0A926RXR6_9BACL|nr:thioesterase family protein [Polycladospora coralii]MBD1372781.1 acyl-CoA thioesterase [Polycladospora coralii]MBS7529521.1 acyl-CoA thioesterase [Polycladospora coralii]
MTTEANSHHSVSDIRVRYQETDQMGIVYHANYLVWFEVGRSDFTRGLGIHYQDIEDKGLLLPIIQVQCRYISPAKYDDEIQVYTELEKLEGSKMSFRYEVKRKLDGQRLVTGQTDHLWVNSEMKRVRIEDYFPDMYQKLTKPTNV